MSKEEIWDKTPSKVLTNAYVYVFESDWDLSEKTKAMRILHKASNESLEDDWRDEILSTLTIRERMENAVSNRLKTQLTLGDILTKLRAIQTATGKDLEVTFDFADLIPTEFISFRGNYSELSLGYEARKHPDYERPKLSEFLKAAESVNGKEMEGYKGGFATMGSDTPVWVANYGEINNTVIFEIALIGEMVVIKTAYMNAWGW